jgi:hypothetical protein
MGVTIFDCPFRRRCRLAGRRERHGETQMEAGLPDRDAPRAIDGEAAAYATIAANAYEAAKATIRWFRSGSPLRAITLTGGRKRSMRRRRSFRLRHRGPLWSIHARFGLRVRRGVDRSAQTSTRLRMISSSKRLYP